MRKLVKDHNGNLNFNNTMADVKRLSDILKKNGVNYKMILRNNSFVLWELLIDGIKAGYEVSEIYLKPEQIKFGKKFQAKESIPSNSKFGIKDHGKNFFPEEFERAINYFDHLTFKYSKNKEAIFNQLIQEIVTS